MERQYIVRELESVAERIQSEVEKLKHISENYRKEYGGSEDDAYIAGFIGRRAETLTVEEFGKIADGITNEQD